MTPMKNLKVINEIEEQVGILTYRRAATSIVSFSSNGYQGETQLSHGFFRSVEEKWLTTKQTRIYNEEP